MSVFLSKNLDVRIFSEMKVDVEGLQEWFNFGNFHFTAQKNHLCPQRFGKNVFPKFSWCTILLLDRRKALFKTFLKIIINDVSLIADINYLSLMFCIGEKHQRRIIHPKHLTLGHLQKGHRIIVFTRREKTDERDYISNISVKPERLWMCAWICEQRFSYVAVSLHRRQSP